MQVRNTGEVSGDDAVLLFATDLVRKVAPRYKLLKGFDKVSLSPGKAKKVWYAYNRFFIFFCSGFRFRFHLRTDFQSRLRWLSCWCSFSRSVFVFIFVFIFVFVCVRVRFLVRVCFRVRFRVAFLCSCSFSRSFSCHVLFFVFMLCFVFILDTNILLSFSCYVSFYIIGSY